MRRIAKNFLSRELKLKVETINFSIRCMIVFRLSFLIVLHSKDLFFTILICANTSSKYLVIYVVSTSSKNKMSRQMAEFKGLARNRAP